MAKAAVIIAVVALCALADNGQHTSDFFFVPTTRPQENQEFLVTLNVCREENLNFRFPNSPNCTFLEVKNHGCHNVDKKWNNQIRGVDTLGRCVHLFDGINCTGERITTGRDCYNVGCCPHSRFLSKCNFANKMSSYMIC